MAGYNERIKGIKLENCRIVFKHFSGDKDAFHKQGERDFSVLIDDIALSQELEAEGWNIKHPKPNPDIAPEDDTRVPSLKVKVNFKPGPLEADERNPKIYLIGTDAHGNQTRERLDETTVGTLDHIQLENVDLYITPYEWEHNGNTGVSAYLSQFYGTLIQVGFQDKYGF